MRQTKMKGSALSGIVMMLACAMLLVIGVLVFSGFASTISVGNGTDSQVSAAVNATKTNTYSGFNIASNLPLVLGAAAVITVVVGSFLVLGNI